MPAKERVLAHEYRGEESVLHSTWKDDHAKDSTTEQNRRVPILGHVYHHHS